MLHWQELNVARVYGPINLVKTRQSSATDNPIQIQNNPGIFSNLKIFTATSWLHTAHCS